MEEETRLSEIQRPRIALPPPSRISLAKYPPPIRPSRCLAIRVRIEMFSPDFDDIRPILHRREAESALFRDISEEERCRRLLGACRRLSRFIESPL